jgi:Alpha/beta hydrolase domain
MPTQLRLHIDSREPFANGTRFGETGAYERLSGRVAFALHPTSPPYQSVVDLPYAPVNDAGLVEYETTFELLKPVELARGNRRLLYDVVNRGNKRAVQFFNDAPHSNAPTSREHAGNGFLMRRGYTVLWCGWQGDILAGEGRMTMRLPIPVGADGPITGRVRAEWIVDEPGVQSLPLSGNAFTRSYPAASLDPADAILTCRAYERDARQPMAPSAWQFARHDAQGAVTPSATHLFLSQGFRPGWIYELVYTATEPLVLGLGFAAVRDLVGFFRFGTQDANGAPNPLREAHAGIDRAYAWGRSQSGRFLREFVYCGWNREAQNRRVFDGVWPHVTGAGRLALNLRFAQPDRYPRQHEHHLYASDQFPFAYNACPDPWSGRTDAILKRPTTDPFIIHTQTASEYWQRRGSLVHTDAFGLDLPEHPQARLFFFASSQHHAAPHTPPEAGPYRCLSNPLQTSALLRALLDALDAWATDGTPPPESRVPRRADGTLVTAEAVRQVFPHIEEVECPAEPNRLFQQDYGPDFARGIINEPPRVDTLHEYTVLVPSIDTDGNDVPGLRTPDLMVPLATYTGWNLRMQGAGGKAMYSIIGSYMPFAATEAERQERRDARPALAERYRSHADYVARVAHAAQQLMEQRLLLPEDVERYIDAAMHTDVRSRP